MSVRRRATSTDGHSAPPHTVRLRQVAVICSLGIALLCAGWGPYGAAPFGGYSPRLCRHGAQTTAVSYGSGRSRFCTGFGKRTRGIKPSKRRSSTNRTSWGHSQSARGDGGGTSTDADAPHPHGEGISRTKPDGDCLRADPAAHADWHRPITRTHAADDLYPCRVPVTLTPEERYHAWHSRRFHAPVWRWWSRR